MQKIDSLIEEKKKKKQPGYIKHEFQDYGYRLARELSDLQHRSLYIKLAKDEKRELLEMARLFVSDYRGAKSKAKVFMWKLGSLKDARTS